MIKEIKENPNMDKVLIKQLEDEVQAILGENFGYRKLTEIMQTLITKNKKRIIEIQQRISNEKNVEVEELMSKLKK